MAVSLVLGGLFLVIVAQAAGLIDTARAWQATRLVENVNTVVGTFRDRYDALPGDSDQIGKLFGRPEARFWTPGGFVSLSGNGRLDGRFFDRASPEGEQYMAWRDLRLARMWPGEAELIGLAAMPDNPFGGVMGFSDANLGLRGVLCLTAVPGEAAAYIDRDTDDGLPATGRTRARVRDTSETVHSVYPDPAQGDYAPDAVYMVCVRLPGLS